MIYRFSINTNLLILSLNKSKMFIKTVVKVIVLLIWIALIPTHAQKQQATIYFNEGKVQEGFVKIKNTKQFKFRKNKKEKPILIDWDSIKKITLFKQGNGKSHFFRVKTGESHEILRLVYQGKVTLYEKSVNGLEILNSFGANQSGTAVHTAVRKYTWYYIQKEGGEMVSLAKDSKFGLNFSKLAADYFSDCNKVKTKIIEGVYTLNNIKGIVFEYNYKCKL